MRENKLHTEDRKNAEHKAMLRFEQTLPSIVKDKTYTIEDLEKLFFLDMAVLREFLKQRTRWQQTNPGQQPAKYKLVEVVGNPLVDAEPSQNAAAEAVQPLEEPTAKKRQKREIRFTPEEESNVLGFLTQNLGQPSAISLISARTNIADREKVKKILSYLLEKGKIKTGEGFSGNSRQKSQVYWYGN